MAAENCILDYKMQQYRLFKAMGASYMMLWTGRNIAQFMADVRQVHAIQNTSPKHSLSSTFSQRDAAHADIPSADIQPRKRSALQGFSDMPTGIPL